MDKISPALCAMDPDWYPKCKKNNLLSSTFTFAEFNEALNNKNIHSCPGVDGIDYDTLQRLPIKYKLFLLDIFNETYKSNSYPQQYKNTLIHFVDKGEGSKLRPLSLTFCSNKLLETTFKNKL